MSSLAEVARAARTLPQHEMERLIEFPIFTALMG